MSRNSRKTWLKEQIKDERKSYLMYMRRGFPEIARDEAKHAAILKNELKKVM
jgi:hypothetical protein